MKMNKQYHDMALQIGGSHYPDVGGQYFIDTVKMVAEKCAKMCEAHGNQKCADEIRNFYDVEKHIVD